jgi:hypothetical protein
MHPELAQRRRVHPRFFHPAFGARLPLVNVRSSGAQAGSAQGSGCRAEDALAPSAIPGPAGLQPSRPAFNLRFVDVPAYWKVAALTGTQLCVQADRGDRPWCFLGSDRPAAA